MFRTYFLVLIVFKEQDTGINFSNVLSFNYLTEKQTIQCNMNYILNISYNLIFFNITVVVL